jgi:hypothetical protein
MGGAVVFPDIPKTNNAVVVDVIVGVDVDLHIAGTRLNLGALPYGGRWSRNRKWL